MSADDGIIEGSVVEENAAAPTPDPEQDSVSRDVVRHEGAQSVNLFNARTPSEVIGQATQVADALKSVLRAQGMIQNIQGREHVKVEGWQTVGAMLGLAARVAWSRPCTDPVSGALIEHDYEVVEFNRKTQVERRFEVTGHDWEARVEIVKGDGTIVASGEGMCSRKESTWAKRDDYALRSMAQTRATSKAFRGVLGFVVTMAGYEATPSDELPPAPPHGAPASEQLSATLNQALAWAETEGFIEPGQGSALRTDIVTRQGYLPTAAAQAVLLVVKAIKDGYEKHLAATEPGRTAEANETDEPETTNDTPEGEK